MIRRNRRVRRHGAALVEFAVVYPAAFLVTFVLLVGGLAAFRYQQVNYLAHAAARFAAVHGAEYARANAAAIAAGKLPNVNQAYLTDKVVVGSAFALDRTRLAAEATITTPEGSFGWDDTVATLDRRPYSISRQNGQSVPVQNSVSVTVSYTWLPGLYVVGPIKLRSTVAMPMTY